MDELLNSLKKGQILKHPLSILVIFICIILLTLNYCFNFYGHFGYDDLHYAKLSAQLLNGEINWQDHFSYRFSILCSTALSYAIFGINDFSSILPSLLLSVLILLIFYLQFKRQSVFLLLIIIFYFSFKWNLFYVDKLMPDIYVSAFLFTAWFTYFKSREKQSTSFWAPLIFSVAFFLAFNAKGTIILILPLFLIYFLIDLKSIRRKFWLQVIAFSSIIFTSYFLLIALLTDHPLSRFKAINSNKYFNDCSYDQLGIKVLIDRLGIDFANLIYKEQLYIPLAVSLIALMLAIIFRNNKLMAKIKFPIATIAILFLAANFMTVSLSSYNPMCLDPRHYLYMTPIAMFCAVLIIQSSIKIIAKDNKIIKVAIVVAASLFLISTFKYTQYSKSLGYYEVKEEMVSVMDYFEDNSNIYCSAVAKYYFDYFRSFKNDNNINFIEIDKIDIETLNSLNNFLFENWYTDWHADLTSADIHSKLNANNLHAKPLNVSGDFKKISVSKILRITE